MHFIFPTLCTSLAWFLPSSVKGKDELIPQLYIVVSNEISVEKWGDPKFQDYRISFRKKVKREKTNLC